MYLHENYLQIKVQLKIIRKLKDFQRKEKLWALWQQLTKIKPTELEAAFYNEIFPPQRHNEYGIIWIYLYSKALQLDE